MAEEPNDGDVNSNVTSFESLQDIFDADDDGLLDTPEKAVAISSTDRLKRSFAEITEFVREHDREPSPDTHDIAERKLGARLDGIRMNPEKLGLLKELDELALLDEPDAPTSLEDLLNGDALGLLDDESGILDVSNLPQRKAPEAPESVAKRTKAEGFEEFEPLFKTKHAELADGTYRLSPFPGIRTIEAGNFFVHNDVMLFVAEVGETTFTILRGKQEQKQRLRVIFENGTESSMYRQSLSIRLHEADGQALARAGHDLDEVGDADKESGHIYVLRSRSEHPQIAAMDNLHKIGFSRNSVEQRIANAANSPTYLMSKVDIVADYRAYNLKPSALEHLLHRVFGEVRLDLTQIDAKGHNYDPAEWFVVPLPVINQAISMIMSGEIVDYVYDRASEQFVERT